MKKIFNLFLIIILVFVLSGCNNNDQKKLSKIKKIKYLELKKDNLVDNLIYSGKVESSFKSKLAFRVAGKIEKIFFNPGEHINKGDLIAQLDPEDYRLRLKSTQQKLQGVLSAHKATESDYKRFLSLYKKNSISEKQMQDITAKYNAEKNNIESIQTNIELIKKQIEYTKIYAPIQGTISMLISEEEETVSAGHPILEFISPDDLEVSIDVSETHINLFEKEKEALLKVWALDNKEFKGIVKEISLNANPYTRTFKVKISINDQNKDLSPGMTCEVIYNTAENDKKYIIIPLSSVFKYNDDPSNVWVFNKKDKKVQVRNIEILKITDKGIIVKEGLDENEIIAVAGVNFLIPDQKVELY